MGHTFRDEWLYAPAPLHVTSSGRFSSVSQQLWFEQLAGISSLNWPANNQAVYMPMLIPRQFTIARFMVLNGSNLTGTVDVGIYSASGTRLLSTGPTARSGSTAVQYIGVTDRSLPPGFYYLAALLTSTTGTVGGVNHAAQYFLRIAGMLQEAVGADTLPATMTPASYTSVAVFHFGFTQSDTL